MTRKCGCSGQCGPQTGEVSRREFIELAGIGAAGAVLGGSAGALAAGRVPAPEDLDAVEEGAPRAGLTASL